MIIIASYSNVSVTYTADGTQTVFSFPFDYLRKAFVYVEVNEETILTQGTDYNVSGKTVVFATAPASGTVLRIYRSTDTTPLVSWADASVLRAKDMTLQQVQDLHILEEQDYWTRYNAMLRDGDTWDARGFQIKDVADPTDPTDAVNKEYLEAEAIVKNSNDTYWVGQGLPIKNIGEPTDNSDVATKQYADNNFMRLDENGTTWVGRGLPVRNIATPGQTKDATTKEYVDNLINTLSVAADRYVVFDTVAAMKAADLPAGYSTRTLGYHDINDGGAGIYSIRGKVAGETEDGGSIIFLDNGNVAELITDGTVCPEQFGAIDNGICNIQKCQKMFDFAIAKKLGVRFVSDFEFQFIPNSTIENPTRLLIKNCDKMIVDGGGHTVTMTGLTTDYLFSIDDDASSGRDVFTFLSFVLCNNIVVQNLNVNGEFVNDFSVTFRYQSPRAKAIGFFGTYYSYVNNCNFDGILGNGVNFTPSSNTRDGSWRNCAYCTVSNVNVRNSLENGLNNMGTTYAIEYTNITATNCTGGIETGIGQSHISNSFFYQCKNSIALGGNDTADNVYCKSCGVYLNSSRDVVISNSTFIIYRSVYMMPGEGSVTFNSCNIMVDEDVEWAGTYNISVYCVGTSAKHIKALILNACYLKIKGLPISINYLDNLIINGCHINTTSGNILIMYNTPNALMLSTLYNGGVAGTFINTLADTNYKYT